MNFEDERYVRIYTRKTLTFKLIGWEGRIVLWHLMLEVDRAGVLDLNGEDPTDAVAAMTDLPTEVVSAGLPRLLDRGVVRVTRDVLVISKFIEAQEAKQSDLQRQRESRQRRRDLDRRSNLIGEGESVTERDTYDPESDESVTNRDRLNGETGPLSHGVTPSCAVPSCAVLSRTKEPPTPSEGDELEPEHEPEHPDAPTDAKDPKAPTAGQTPRVDPDDEVATKVFEFWKSEHNHPKARLERKRRNRIKARLREGFTGRDLCLAIRGARRDPFLMGENSDGKVYDGLQTLLRDAEQVERLIALAGPRRGESAKSGPTPADRERARIAAERERQWAQDAAELAQTGTESIPSVKAILEGIGGR